MRQLHRYTVVCSALHVGRCPLARYDTRHALRRVIEADDSESRIFSFVRLDSLAPLVRPFGSALLGDLGALHCYYALPSLPSPAKSPKGFGVCHNSTPSRLCRMRGLTCCDSSMVVMRKPYPRRFPLVSQPPKKSLSETVLCFIVVYKHAESPRAFIL